MFMSSDVQTDKPFHGVQMRLSAAKMSSTENWRYLLKLILNLNGFISRTRGSKSLFSDFKLFY